MKGFWGFTREGIYFFGLWKEDDFAELGVGKLYINLFEFVTVLSFNVVIKVHNRDEYKIRFNNITYQDAIYHNYCDNMVVVN